MIPQISCIIVILVMTVGDACGINKPMTIANAQTGEFTSPNYPSPYPNDADCQWHINVDDGFVVQLTFVEFDLEDG